jgi:hypothetical protein
MLERRGLGAKCALHRRGFGFAAGGMFADLL